jgi:hypothetical protein
MSSPRGIKAKAAGAVKPAKAAAKTTTSRAKSKPESELSGEDKAHFVKAMWVGLKDPNAPPAPEPPKVEVLRRIPAPVVEPSRSTPASEEALKLATLVEAKVAEGDLDILTPEAVQALMAALCKLYGANVESGNKYPLLGGRMAVTGTDAMIACGGLLKAVDLQVFELGMWQSWSGL